MRFSDILVGFVFLIFFFVLFPVSIFAADSWINTGNMITPRFWHTATLLNSGKVLVVGGENSGQRLKQAEIYDPASGSWSRAADLSHVRKEHTANLVVVNNATKETRVLIVGGLDSSIGSYSNKAELYDPSSNTWSSASNMTYKKNTTWVVYS